MSDSDALLQLTRRTPMQADISLQIEREPNFFALSEARGRSRTVVAEENGVVVGCATAARRPVRWGDGDVREIGIIADLKVEPSYRRKGVAQALLDELAELERDEPPAIYVATTAAGNGAVDRVALRFGSGRGLTCLAEFVSWQLFGLPGAASAPGVEIRQARASDVDELVELLEAFHRPYALSPVFVDGGFEATIAGLDDIDLSDYRVALRNGRIVAAVADWTPHSLKRVRVMSMPFALRQLTGAARVLAHVAPVPSLPAPGELLELRYLRHPAHRPGEEAALRALVVDASQRARRAGAHFALFTAAVGDPLQAIVRRLPKTSYRYRLVAGFNRPEAASWLDELTNRLIYDDAALS